MALDVQISCIKFDGSDEDYRIDNVGGTHAGERWNLTIDQAIKGIDDKKYTFYTLENMQHANVVIRVSAANRRYLTTLPDNSKANNLSRLRQCP